MKNSRVYIYSFPNASCTIRIVVYLRSKYQAYLNSIAVINLVDRWLIKLNLKAFAPERAVKNLQAFMEEMGSVAQPTRRVIQALDSLDRGESPTVVMNRYQVVIVAYGQPETEEIEIFRDRIVDRLGYCPQNMT